MDGIHKNHRKRMYRKAEEMGLQNLEEHEILEIILYAIVPQGNTNGIARELILRFGSIAGVIRADENELTEVKGVGIRIAKFLRNLYDVLGVVERYGQFPDKRIQSTADAIDYVKSFFKMKSAEQFYMLSLNRNGGVINSHLLSSGISDEVHIYPQSIAKKALLDDAYSVIIVHNHPGGTLTASYSDEDMTLKIKKFLEAIGVELFDSLIISGEDGASILNQIM